MVRQLGEECTVPGGIGSSNEGQCERFIRRCIPMFLLRPWRSIGTELACEPVVFEKVPPWYSMVLAHRVRLSRYSLIVCSCDCLQLRKLRNAPMIDRYSLHLWSNCNMIKRTLLNSQWQSFCMHLLSYSLRDQSLVFIALLHCPKAMAKIAARFPRRTLTQST